MEHSFAGGAGKTGFPLFPRCLLRHLGTTTSRKCRIPEVGQSALAETGLLCMVSVISNRRLSRGLSQDRTLAGSLQHFHFWCLQSYRAQRGFSSRKAALRCPVLFRVEVKMLECPGCLDLHRGVWPQILS